jgi:hypothetical protein
MPGLITVPAGYKMHCLNKDHHHPIKKPNERYFHPLRLANGSHSSRSFPGQSLFFWGGGGFQQLCPGVRQNSVRDTKCRGVLQVLKCISDNIYYHTVFPKVGDNMYSSRTASNQPLTGRNGRSKA